MKPNHSNTSTAMPLLRTSLLMLQAALLSTSFVFLVLAGDAAPWYGWTLNLGWTAFLIALVVLSRHMRIARIAFGVGLVLVAVGSVGAFSAVAASGLR